MVDVCRKMRLISAFGVVLLRGQDLIIGVEATYTHTNLNTTASSSPIGATSRNGPAVSNPHVVSANGAANSVNISGTGNLDLTDYASVRTRAGYVVAICYRMVSWALWSGAPATA
jgi:hypothetical protein